MGDEVKRKNQLSQLDFFHDIASETVERLWAAGKVLDFQKGTVLIRAKEPVEYVFFQLSGKSIVYNLTHDGRRKILFVFGRGIMLNEHVFNIHTTSLYCETIDKSKVFKVPVSEFEKLMQSDFELTKRVFEAQERKIWRLSHQLKNTMSGIYLERKLAAKLWKLSRDFGIPKDSGIEIDINMTITFLADMLGVPRETTSRVCSALVDNGLITMNKRRILISNPDKLSMFYKTGSFE